MIICKNMVTCRHKYIDKKNNLYESVLIHIRNIYWETEHDNIKNLYEKSTSQEEILRDDHITGLYIIKDNETYILYKKTVEMKNNGWIRNNLVSEVKNIKLAEYYEAELEW